MSKVTHTHTLWRMIENIRKYDFAYLLWHRAHGIFPSVSLNFSEKRSISWLHIKLWLVIYLTEVLQTFRVYESGMSGPVCFFLHGGGYSGLSWAVLSVSTHRYSISLSYSNTWKQTFLDNNLRFLVYILIM